MSLLRLSYVLEGEATRCAFASSCVAARCAAGWEQPAVQLALPPSERRLGGSGANSCAAL